MAKNTSISLGRHFDTFIHRQVAKGRYGTASEVVRAGLRILEEEEAKMAALRSAIDQGDHSGFAEDYDLDRVIADVRRKRR